MKIRSALLSDFYGIAAVDPSVRGDPLRETLLQNHVQGGRCWVAEELDDVIGFFVLEYSFYGNGFLSLLVVRQDSRRRGVGRTLLKHAMSICTTEKLFTSTNESNTPMRSLLRKERFEDSGVIHNLDESDPELVFFRKVRE
ncbi:MAG: GNAT family N-acetyltransferase [Planctomycetaceae bacterium]